jgi:hypothetical protein
MEALFLKEDDKMQAVPNDKTQRHSPSLDLLLTRIERHILEGQKAELCREILAKESLWKNADVEMRLRWARLAQMAGEVEAALQVLAHVNRTDPENPEGWNARLELLMVLDRRGEMAQVLAASKPYLGDEGMRIWGGVAGKRVGKPDGVEEAASAPFLRMQERQATLVRFMDLFSGREDCFARQWADRDTGKQGYIPVRRPMNIGDLEEHLKGQKTYGIYLLRSDGTVKTAVMDVDLTKDYRVKGLKADDSALVKREANYLYSRIREMAAEFGLKPAVEYSGGKGFHFWFFFEAPIDASRARRLLERISNALYRDLTAFHLEVFPKQDQLSGKGFGNLVKLPLGIHRLSGKRSHFIQCRERSVEAQLEFLLQVRPTSIELLKARERETGEAKVVLHPRLQKWTDDYPELSKLEALCPPLGQIIATLRQGKAVSAREEKVLYQTVGFLERAKTLMHTLMSGQSDYNPHLVDYHLTRLRGAPLGCRRIHSLLNFSGDLCPFSGNPEYPHPLLHLGPWEGEGPPKAEKAENLSAAMENLKLAMTQVQRFLS